MPKKKFVSGAFRSEHEFKQEPKPIAETVDDAKKARKINDMRQRYPELKTDEEKKRAREQMLRMTGEKED